jgi:hypothetical protein
MNAPQTNIIPTDKLVESHRELIRIAHVRLGKAILRACADVGNEAAGQIVKELGIHPHEAQYACHLARQNEPALGLRISERVASKGAEA